MNKLFVLFFVGLAVANANISPFHSLVELYVNNRLPDADSVCREIKIGINNFKSQNENLVVDAPDIKEKSVILSGHNIKFELTNGKLFGLDTLQTDGKCIVPSDDKFAYIQSRYSFEKFRLNYNYDAVYNGNHVRGELVAENTGLQHLLTIKINRRTLQVSVVDYVIECYGSTKVTVEGVTDNVSNIWITKAVVRDVQQVLRNTVSQLIDMLVADASDDVY